MVPDQPQPGPGVDALGNPVPDPTRNVLDLVEAAIKRQDDLRELTAVHQQEMAAMRHDYERELRESESARIDAIRAVDVGAVNRAAEVSATQAATLATQVATSAETLRAQVAAAAQQAATALAAALEPIQKDIADLRKTQYEQAGRQVQTTETKADTSTAATGNRAWVTIAIAAAGVFSAFITVALAIVTAVLVGRT